ncbi:hypothetical protein QIA01_05140 (plasmid) [Borreliella americana]
MDENVFDIQTRGCIAIFTKYKYGLKKSRLAKVFYKSIKGKREKNMIF